MKIKINEIEELAEYYKTDVYGGRNAAFMVDEMLYEGKYKESLGIATEHKANELILSKARDMVDIYTNYTNVDNARISVNKRRPDKLGDKEDKAKQQFGQGYIYMTNLDAEISPYWSAAKHYWLHGMCVLRTLWVPDMWSDKPVRSEKESDESYGNRINKWQEEIGIKLPIRTTCMHPSTIYPDPDSRHRDHVIEINEYHWIKARKFNKFKNKKGRKGAEKVVQISYWDGEKHTELIDGECIIPGKGWDYHEYGEDPYTILNSGLGNINSNCDMSEKYMGLLRPVKDLLIAISSNFSISNIILKKNAWPQIMLEGENAQLADIQDRFGRVNVIPEGVKFHEYQHLPPPEQCFTMFMMMLDMLDEHGATKTMMGGTESGVRSGSHERIKSAQSSVRLRHAEMNFKNRIPDVITKAANIASKVVPDNVRVFACTTGIEEFDTTIKKDLLKEPFNYSIEFSPVSPEEEYRRSDDIQRKLAAGIYSHETAIEKTPEVDYGVESKRQKKEFYRNSPAIQEPLMRVAQMLTTQAATELMSAEQTIAGANPLLGMKTQLPYGNMGANPMGQQQQMSGMVPDMSNRAQPGSAQALQNEIAARRGPNPMRGQQGRGGGGERGINR